jgi:methionyl-tRNA formyltransferase
MRKVIFFGLRKYGALFLQKLIKDFEVEVLKVYTKKEDFLFEPSFDAICENYKISLNFVNKFDNEIINDIIKLEADIILCYSFHLKIPSQIIKHYNKKIINFHPSYLPELRGANPIEWALYYGYKETGITAHFMENKIDSGKIIYQTIIKINSMINAEELSFLIFKESLKILKRIFKLNLKNFKASIQNSKKSTCCCRRCELDFEINIKKDCSKNIINKIRAGYIYPVAFLRYKHQIFRIKKIAIIDEIIEEKLKENFFIYEKNYYIRTLDKKILRIIDYYREDKN